VRNRLEVWSSVSTTVPSPQTVLSFAANPSEDPHVSRDDWMLLTLVDGRRTVAEIVRLLGRGDFAVVSALADLISRGLLVTADTDVVADMARRYDVLARLETGAATVAAEPVVEVAPEPDAVPVPADVDDEFEDDDDEDEDDESIVSDVDAPAEPAPSKPLAPVAPQQRVAVTPQRSEPVLPAREVAYPEPPSAMVAVGGAAAMPAAAIERDPSVNKSLLLRLIAGVRGL
jgi:hypothetical protein